MLFSGNISGGEGQERLTNREWEMFCFRIKEGRVREKEEGGRGCNVTCCDSVSPSRSAKPVSAVTVLGKGEGAALDCSVLLP